MAREPKTEIATIEERSSFSAGGVVAIIFLVLHNLLMLLWFGSAKSAPQEAAAGTIWIAGNVLWGACMLAGRRRNYVVYRSPQPPT